MIRRLLKLLRAAPRTLATTAKGTSQSGSTRSTRLHPEGFHGDRYLQAVARTLLAEADGFVETGTNVGSTLAWVARSHPALPCWSCEPDHEAFTCASQNLRFASNVNLGNYDSQYFLGPDGPVLKLTQKDFVFWLDAHGYGFQWPLRLEVSKITSHWSRASILIDDFKVPGLDCFAFDAYDGQECSMAFIEDHLDQRHHYHIYYPAYTDRTSDFHPLKGWVLIRYGYAQEPDWPEVLAGRLKHMTHVPVDPYAAEKDQKDNPNPLPMDRRREEPAGRS